MSDPNAQEPTMEEILASIRRIISEDEPAAEASTAAESASPPHGDEQDLDDEEEVLELTQRAEEPAAESMFEPEAGASETSGDLEIYERPAPARRAATVTMDAEPDFDDLEEDRALVGEPAAATASSAFDQLARTVTMPSEGRTLEDVVRELLRPMLKDWLDRNLPDIVETAVEAEVERISRRRFS